MAERILLVTGSRALADSVAAERWAHGEITRVLDAFLPTLVAVGDAPGADRFATALAHARGVAVQRWVLTGAVVTTSAAGVEELRWWPKGAAKLEPSRWPLARNAAMCSCVGLIAANGDVARALALTAPWAKTHGTAHTVARAREAGLVVEVRACPAELGPREVRT